MLATVPTRVIEFPKLYYGRTRTYITCVYAYARFQSLKHLSKIILNLFSGSSVQLASNVR